MTRSTRYRLHYAGAVAWILLTVSLASWWLIFGLEQARRLAASGAPDASAPEGVQRMLGWEGASFILLLVGGGIVLVISVHREHARQREVEAFFMAFTHDLKTSLASLQLQAESLREDQPEAARNPHLDRLMKDALRLQLQLENSLYFAEPGGGLCLESVDLRTAVTRVAGDWPELTVEIDGDARATVDTRALESVLRNLFQNAVTHGGAARVRVRLAPASSGRVAITATDNGRGATPDVLHTLGRPFSRPTPLSGTGVGLFVSRRLVERMHGAVAFATTPGAGFTAIVELPASGEGAAA